MTVAHVTVKIFGEAYPIRTAEPASRLEELAAYVDARMREVAASGKVVVTSKVAVLTALHIADELFRLRESQSRPTPPAGALSPMPEMQERLRALVEALERALAAPRGGSA